MHARVMGIVTSITSAKCRLKWVQNIKKELSDIELSFENFQALKRLTDDVMAIPGNVIGGKEILLNRTINLKSD